MILGSLVAVMGTALYLFETMCRKTKPRIVAWFTWALLAGLASMAVFIDHQFAGGLFGLIGAAASGVVVIGSLRYGDRNLSHFDVACLMMVLVGIAVWRIFSNPALGVWAAIVVDFIGLMPTARHVRTAPYEETVFA